jgi:hypothetical protein
MYFFGTKIESEIASGYTVMSQRAIILAWSNNLA